MNITELAESIQCALESSVLDRNGLRNSIGQLLDKAYEIENRMNVVQKRCEIEINEIMGRMQDEIDKVVSTLNSKHNSVVQMQKRATRNLDKIELLLYEKNDYPNLRDVIEFVKQCKQNQERLRSFYTESNVSGLNDEAFCINSQNNSLNILNNTNNIIIHTPENKVKELISAIQKSSVSLNQKEQMVYNLIVSQSRSQMKHVKLDDILDVSYAQQQQNNSNASFLNSLSQKFNQRVRLNENQILSVSPIKNDQSSIINLDEVNDIISPKFQFNELSPIKSQEQMVWIDSFRNYRKSSQKHVELPKQHAILIPRIKLESLKKSAEAKSELVRQRTSHTSNSSRSIKKCPITEFNFEKKVQRKKALSSGENKKSYEQIYLANLVSRINNNRGHQLPRSGSKSLVNESSVVNRNRNQNQTFHQKQQNVCLKELMGKIYKRQTSRGVQSAKDQVTKIEFLSKPQVSDYEKKQISMLMGKIKMKKIN